MTSQLQVLLILIITTTRVLVKNVFSFFLALIFGGFYTICVSFTFDSIRKRNIFIIIGINRNCLFLYREFSDCNKCIE